MRVQSMTSRASCCPRTLITTYLGTMGMAILCFILKPWHAGLLCLPPRNRNTSTRAIVFVQLGISLLP